MRNVGLIAWNTLLETLGRRVVQVAALLVLLSLAQWYFSAGMIQKARDASEMDLVAKLAAAMVTQSLERWAITGQLLALFLGAGALATEMRTRTIVTLLARPVERWQVLAAKLVAAAGSGLLFVLVGLVLALGVAWYFGLPAPPLLWLAFAEAVTQVVLATGIAVALSAVLGPVASGIGAFVLWSVLPALAELAMRWAGPVSASVARVGYYLAPAKMPVDLLAHAYQTTLVAPRYALYAGVMLENVLYAVAAMLIASFVFARRDITAG